MKRIILRIFSFCLLIPIPGLHAQEVKKWNLRECIDYAVEHNIDIQLNILQKQSREVELDVAKSSRLPDLNAVVNQGFGFGWSATQTGESIQQNSSSTGFSIQTGMPLFTGFKISGDIEVCKLNLNAAVESLNKAKDDLQLNITSAFLDVLFNKEILAISERQVELTRRQLDRTEMLIDAGKVPPSQLSDIKAQLAKDELTLTQAQNNEKLSRITLAQYLDLERFGDQFDIRVPDSDHSFESMIGSLLPPDHIYNNAVTFKPQVKEQEYLLESGKKSLKTAESGYWPKLSLNASYGVGYYHYYGDEFLNKSFSDQLRDNGITNIGLTLSIPIFNRFEVKNQVKSARIEIKNRELALEKIKKDLYKEIQQAYYNAVAAQSKYYSAGKAGEAAKESYRYAEEKYGAGKSTVFEYNEAKTKMLQSLSEEIQAKYDFIFRMKILDFYNGNPIDL
ncbi:MAG: TolC family protein [Candidatus Azobacteroides sp.]|nr:TolC family protein [Candidatus Azobacteroides sp.]